MKKITTLLMLIALISFSSEMFAQCDSLADYCQKHITSQYISDGQTYRALLSGDDVAEFQTTLFKGTTYRIAACSGSTDNNLIFKIVDQDKNILFSNADYSNAAYWDFFVEYTMSVTIESTLDKNKTDSGCAVIVIGFKK
jgi:hypothetical protein